MQKHTKILFDYFGYDESSFVPCEICGAKATEVHHIDCKGMGGSKIKDYIENLMSICRYCHGKYGDKKQYIEFLKQIHLKFMKDHAL